MNWLSSLAPGRLLERWRGHRRTDWPEMVKLFDLGQALLAVLDRQNRFARLSDLWERRLGYPKVELVGWSFLDIVMPEEQQAADSWLAEVRASEKPVVARLACRDERGLETHLTFTGQTLYGGEYLLLTSAEERGEGTGPHRDPLTGVLDRLGFMARLHHSCDRRRRGAGGPFAVLLLDLDRFKQVNDGYGHSAGDAFLVAVVERLQSCLRPGDSVARIGGDEFAVLLERLSTEGDALRIAGRIKQSLHQPIDVDGKELHASASIGVALSEEHDAEPERLLRHADAAMYRAKAKGRGQFALFDTDLRRSTLENQLLGSEVEEALEQEQFQVYYQPRVNLDHGSICGFEALLRWQHPRHGLLRPDAFLKIVDDAGQLVRLERWLLKEACRQLVEWDASAQDGRAVSLSVNLCEREFHQTDLADFFERLLADFDVDRGRLMVEVTESCLLDHSSNSLRRIQGLRRLGIPILLDDFGSGYSSLSLLHRFPVRGVKIDHAFIQQVPGNRRVTEVVRSISSMARSLGLIVVAEGVADLEQLRLLREFRCAFAEGPLFAQPVAGSETIRLLSEDRRW